MKFRLRTSASVAALGIFAAAQAQQDSNLRDHVNKVLKWDVAASGPLLALSMDDNYRRPDMADELASYHVKKVKVGGITLLTADTEPVFEDSDLPNAYDLLSNEEKIKFLLASLSAGDLQRLNGAGLCADDLRGEPRAALLSLIPKPLRFLSGTVTAPGSVEGRPEPQTLPENLYSRVRLQLHKGLHVGSNPTSTGQGSYSYSVTSSLTYRGPVGAQVVYSGGTIGPSIFQKPVRARIVPSTEKKSALSWSDSRLAGMISLAPKTTVGAAIDQIRSQTGIEIYAEAGVAPIELDAMGTSIKTADLLHGIMVLVGGAIRQVGSVYVLAPNVEGQGAKEARFQVRQYLEELQIRNQVTAWDDLVERSGILQKLAFSPQDALGASSVSPSNITAEGSRWDNGWVSLDNLPSGFRAIVEADASRGRDPKAVPYEPLQGKVKLTTAVGYRFVLPDGRPLEYTEFQAASRTTMQQPNKPNPLPTDFSALQPGSAVGIRGDDAATIAGYCGKLKEVGVTEIWLRSTSSEAIQAAIDSGMKVDLVVNPFRLLPSETSDDIDRDVMLMTGGQLEKIPAAKVERDTRQTRIFGDSISPADPAFARHLNRLLELIPKKGLNRIILEDREPRGYEAPSPNGTYLGPIVTSEGPILPGLGERAVGSIDFGYTMRLRLAFIRKYRMDPIDLIEEAPNRLIPSAPYFEPRPMMPILGREYVFPSSPLNDRSLTVKWGTLRREAYVPVAAKLDAEFARFGIPVLARPPREADQFPGTIATYLETDPDIKPEAKKYVWCFTVNPQTSEDADGRITYSLMSGGLGSLCFDLSEVPAKRFDAYLRYLLKKVK